jgi:hypothetical protein
VELHEMDTGLLEVLREAGDRWGPAGVARAATALIGDALAGDAVGEPEQPGPVVVDHSVRAVLGPRPLLAGLTGALRRARIAEVPDRARLAITREKADGWVFTWAWSSPVGEDVGLPEPAREPEPWTVRLDPYPAGPYPGVIPARHGADD